MVRRQAVVTLVVLTALALAAVPIVLAVAAPSDLGGLAPRGERTESGRAINELYWFVVGMCLVVFVLVESALVLFALRFRRQETTPVDAEGPQIHGNTRLEIIWTLIPTVLLAIIAVVVVIRVPVVHASGEADAPDELVVRVEGHQFYWRYVYPGGEISLDTLVLPVGRPVTLELTSYDVIHSWWVPELTGKQDAITGQQNDLRFEPSTEGTYEGQCAEFCGILHAVMPTTVEVVSQDEFERRLDALSGQQSSGDAQLALGRASWESACAKCHGPEGQGDVGPPIARNPTLVDEARLRELLTGGQNTPDIEGYMPPVGRGWPDFQIRALVEYIRSNDALAAEGDGGGGGG